MTALTTNTPQRLVLAPGRIYTATNVLAGATEGPIAVEIDMQVRQVPVEGVLQPVAELEYPTSDIIRLTFALKEVHDANVTTFLNHGTAPTGTPPTSTWTGPAHLALLTANNYINDVRVLSPTTAGNVIGYNIPRALVTSAVLQTPAAPGEGVIQVTLESRATLAAPNGKTYTKIRLPAFP